jgi:hypothetical protein
MLDERGLRKPGFSEGCKITLADGQEWTLPKPKICFRPKVIGGRVEIGGGPSFGPEFDDELDILFGVSDPDPIERLRVKFDLAVRLLSANYVLTPENLGELLVLEPANEVSIGRWEQLTSAIMGVAPKHSPVI